MAAIIHTVPDDDDYCMSASSNFPASYGLRMIGGSPMTYGSPAPAMVSQTKRSLSAMGPATTKG
jgi:hypothetical protein